MNLDKDKIQKIDDRLQKNAEKLETAKNRLKKIQDDHSKLEAEKNKILIEEYLPVLQTINLSPTELKEFFADDEEKKIEVLNEEY